MPVSENAGRANSPDLKELVSHTDDLKELLEAQVKTVQKVMDERDIRYEQRFRALDEKTTLAHVSAEKAVNKADLATEKRFDSVNEFRGSLKDQAATLLPRAEAESNFKSLESKIEEIKREKQAQSRFDLRTILAVIALIISIASIWLRNGR